MPSRAPARPPPLAVAVAGIRGVVAMIDVEVTSGDGIPRGQVEAARARLASLDAKVDEPLLGVRLTLRRWERRRLRRPVVADASVLFEGRVLAAHAPGRTAPEAAEIVAERLRRQLRRIVDGDVAERNEPRFFRDALQDMARDDSQWPELQSKPPEDRAIVTRHTFAEEPEPTLTAIADMLDLDERFHLFTHVRTNEDVVVHRIGGAIGLIFPPGSVLADEGDLVAPEPSWFADPVNIEDVRTEMDLGEAHYLYFLDAADNRGKVLYQRFDGDYGLVVPW